MTYISFWLEVEQTDGAQPKRLAHHLPDPPAGRFGPHALKNWATRERLVIEYVDNCWLRVGVQRAKLAEFFTELYAQEAEFPLAILAALPSGWKFTLVAEEF